MEPCLTFKGTFYAGLEVAAPFYILPITGEASNFSKFLLTFIIIHLFYLSHTSSL